MKKLLPFLFLLLGSCLAAAQGPTINACGQGQPIHVVIIGSSTAAGTGPSVPDSTWVNRYRAYLQGINIQNQVTNLARGGTTTYQIMPSWFVAPMGRPATDTSRNVTKALSLQPDAIVINMPSNDVATNVTLQEQMSNYRVMVAVADSLGIPVWVCTTQPRNFGSAAQRALQVAARDSIFVEYGIKAIDFWTGFATSTDSIDPLYDSGDGVHLNDAAHGILFARVADVALPNLLADTAASEDLVALQLLNAPYSICGDTLTTVQVVVGNLGPAAGSSTILELLVVNTINTMSSTQTQTMTSIPACGLDTLTFALNTATGVNYSLSAYITGPTSFNANDTTNTIAIQTIGRPDLQLTNVYQCQGDSSQIPAQGAGPLDKINWYAQAGALTPFYTGNTLPLAPLSSDQTYYAQIARGPFYFFDQLATSTATNINWNGVAFDLVAKDSLVVDSLATKLATIGLQTVVAYYRLGGQTGYLNTPAAWTKWDTVAVQVTTAGNVYNLALEPLPIAAGDTVGIYLHLQAASARLGYSSNGTTNIYTDNQLEIIGGSGVNHTFGALYTPRNWAGVVHYHYGNNPNGSCQSPRLPVLVDVSTPVELGNDTTVVTGQTVFLAPTGSYASYQWSNGSTAASVVVDSSWAILGQALVYVTVTDVQGCTSIDSVQITFSTFTGIADLQEHSIQLYPNPSAGQLFLTQQQTFDYPVQVVNAQGVVVWVGSAQAQQTLSLEALPKGIYWLVYSTKQQRQRVGFILR